MLKENLNIVKNNIASSCEIAKRKNNDVTLIAVSKTKPINMIKELYDEKIKNFGENHVLELCEKANKLPKDIKWHMIGHLQRNKVKELLKHNIELIHSVDSLRLAIKINDEAIKANKTINILLEVNIANDEAKHGFKENEIYEVMNDILNLSNINVEGLMTVAPFTSNPENNRKYFRKLKELSLDLNKKYNISINTLSMGMSNDYMVAIEEGATMVRVGTAIFGERDYKKK